MIKRCADSLGDTVSKIKDKMIGSALGHSMKPEPEWIKNSGS